MNASNGRARLDPTGALLTFLAVALLGVAFVVGSDSPTRTVLWIGLLGTAALSGSTKRAYAAHASILALLTVSFGAVPAVAKLWPLGLLLALAFHALFVSRMPPLRATMTWLRPGSIDRGTAVLMAATALVAGVALVAWRFALRPDVSDLQARLPAWPAFGLVLLGIGFALANSVAEELAFRGVFMEALGVAFGPRAGLVLQALAFGIVHLHGFPRGWVGVGLAAIYGLLLGVLRQRSQGLLAPIIGHAAADLVIFGLLVWG